MLLASAIRTGQIPRVDTFAFKADEKLCALALSCNEKVNSDIQAFQGRVVSGDQFISDKEKKKWLAEEFGAKLHRDGGRRDCPGSVLKRHSISCNPRNLLIKQTTALEWITQNLRRRRSAIL